MIKILIVEDTSFKANKIVKIVQTISGCSYEVASDIVTARKYLHDHFDLMIIDMNLPERFSELPQEGKGLEFIDELKKSLRLKLPEHILGITEFEEIHKKFKDKFESKLISLIKYDQTKSDWANQIYSKVTELINLEHQRFGVVQLNYDVAFLTALRTPELEAILNLSYGWTKFKIANDSSNYYNGKIDIPGEKTLNVVATYQPQMGMVATATSAMKLIQNFRPKYIIMTGICGGVEGKVNLGDIVISDMSFDIDSGKIIVNDEGNQDFEPDFKVIPLHNSLKEDLQELAVNKPILRGVKDSWLGQSLSNELTLHIGPVGSTAAVISNAAYISEKIKHQRKLIAVDMESYALFYCCEYSSTPHPIPISIKAVSDFANPKKSDDLQTYCSTMAAKLADHVVKNILSFE